MSRLPRCPFAGSFCSGFDTICRAFVVSLTASTVSSSCCMPRSDPTLVELGCRYSPSRLLLRTNDDEEELLPRWLSDAIQGSSTFELRGIAGVMSSVSGEKDTFRALGLRG